MKIKVNRKRETTLIIEHKEVMLRFEYKEGKVDVSVMFTDISIPSGQRQRDYRMYESNKEDLILALKQFVAEVELIESH